MIRTFFLLAILTLAMSDTAIVTYHLYKRTDLLTTVACSDGKNGIMNWGYKDLSMMFPYVTAWQSVTWNSPQCGSCAKITYKGRYVYVTVIDQCGVINPLLSHFDMSKQAFTSVFGAQGIAKGSMTANFTLVTPKLCKGNRKGLVGDSIYIHLQNDQSNIKQNGGGDLNENWGYNLESEQWRASEQSFSQKDEDKY